MLHTAAHLGRRPTAPGRCAGDRGGIGQSHISERTCSTTLGENGRGPLARGQRATMSPQPRLPAFAESDAEAESRFARWRSTDPFPEVASALLNSADLLDYVATVGILYPFDGVAEKPDDWLKPASCAVPCSGEYIRWPFDPKRLKSAKDPETGTLEPDDWLLLPANTITFLQLGTTFRIPNYLAARFNLTIREIHRGLLVGTGPLVDPGFDGQLLMPLHNLTANDYRVKCGEPLIWVEFTKLSNNPAWGGGGPEPREAGLAEFPDRKRKRKTAAAYLGHANEGRPIASSIPEQVASARSIAEKAARRVRNLGVAGVATLLIASVGAVYPIVDLVSTTNDRLDRSTQQIATQQQLANTLERDLETVKRQQKALCRELPPRERVSSAGC
jgi:hypothetical protein